MRVPGIVVDYNETGVSYFIEPKTGERVGEITQWSDHYTQKTHVAQLQLAQHDPLGGVELLGGHLLPA